MSIIKNNKGITLVELLAVLAISSIIITSLYSFTMTMLKAEDRTSEDISIRNEIVILKMELNEFFENAKKVEDNGNFITVYETADSEVGENLEFNNGNIYIADRQINSSYFVIEKISFNKYNKTFHLHLLVQNGENPDIQEEIYLVYPIREGGSQDNENNQE